MLLMLTCNESTILNKLITFLKVVLISKMANIDRYNLHRRNVLMFSISFKGVKGSQNQKVRELLL